MIVRTSQPVDQAFLLDIDYEPWFSWSHMPPELVVKILELHLPVGFLAYKFFQKTLVLEKLAIRDDLIRTGLGTEAIDWLTKHAKRKGMHRVEASLSEDFALLGACHFLKKCNFQSKYRRNMYIFTRGV